MSDMRKLMGLPNRDVAGEEALERAKALKRAAEEEELTIDWNGNTQMFERVRKTYPTTELSSTDNDLKVMQIAGIKGRFQHLNIEWSPEIEQEARRRDGGGITVYLETVEQEQLKAREEARRAVQGYGAWE